MICALVQDLSARQLPGYAIGGLAGGESKLEFIRCAGTCCEAALKQHVLVAGANWHPALGSAPRPFSGTLSPRAAAPPAWRAAAAGSEAPADVCSGLVKHVRFTCHMGSLLKRSCRACNCTWVRPTLQQYSKACVQHACTAHASHAPPCPALSKHSVPQGGGPVHQTWVGPACRQAPLRDGHRLPPGHRAVHCPGGGHV